VHYGIGIIHASIEENGVEDTALYEFDIRARKIGSRAGGEIVEHANVNTAHADELMHQIGTDEASSPSYKNIYGFSIPAIRNCTRRSPVPLR
jgi:hypothetical protein